MCPACNPNVGLGLRVEGAGHYLVSARRDRRVRLTSVTSGCCDVDNSLPVGRVVALQPLGADRGHRDDSGCLCRQVEAGARDDAIHDREATVVGAAAVDELVLQINVGVSG